MKTSPLVSIALCTYNGSKYLAVQLESVLNQTYLNLEIVIVDDRSTDSTYELLISYQSKYPNIIRLYRNERNLGFIKNFEKAISLCHGSLIALSDQDDIWDCNKIAIQVENIKESILIYHDSLMVNEEGISLQKSISNLKNMYSGGSPLPFLFNNCVSGHSVLMKKELIKDILPFPKEIFYDWWIAFKATQAGTISYLNDTLVHYRQHEGTITSPTLTTKTDEHIASTNLSILKVLALSKNKKYADLINLIQHLVHKKNQQLFHLKLFVILFNYQDEIFFISKKNKASKLNRIFKNIWSNKLHI
ncbi:glycosyltransferase involved in cell wall biosynthesis [Algoriphagus sp. 4150]|uniref:glycosyltransferase family 2 protein n=1 Tax=Algoriphagus sp. 4150 TaxID=2817756 RepID=UPI00285E32FF|nr:glycosyltransferase family 2 protein [Algoriphagus sp. 4150]MDR7130092.1 glycosyltransferase involved in cell wall biosynthesis [Algoriphagus sp. 4150]